MGTIEKATAKMLGKAATAPTKPTNALYSVPRKEVNASMTLHLPWDLIGEKGMLTPDSGRSQIAEELRAIKRPILKKAFALEKIHGSRDNLVMITSAVPGEGKSFSAINLAISIAMELDRTALLVDADVAKPSLGKYLNFRAEKGLVDFLLDVDIPLSDVLIRTNLPKLSILPAGRQHHYSTELLASENMKILLDELSMRYHDRVIIFDSPPILATSEAQVLAAQMGQVVVVVEAIKTSQAQLKEALLKIKDSNITGLMLNKSRIKSGGSHYDDVYGYRQRDQD